MDSYYTLTDELEKQAAYNAMRQSVLDDHESAELQQDEDGFCIAWLGIAISDSFSEAYYAWQDAALPY